MGAGAKPNPEAGPKTSPPGESWSSWLPWAILGVGCVPSQLLLFAEPLMREGLTRLLEAPEAGYRVVSQPTELEGRPELVIWHPGSVATLDSLRRELEQLRSLWQPAPLLLLLPQDQPHPTAQLLQLPVAGLLEAPEPQQLLDAIATLRAGGRVVALADAPDQAPFDLPTALGIGHRFLLSGLQQIDADLDGCRTLLSPPPRGAISLLVLQGRLRELRAARHCLLLLWGPLDSLVAAAPSAFSQPLPQARLGTQLTLPSLNAEGIWQTLRARLEDASQGALNNQSGQLLALQGLGPDRRRDLMLALLQECDGARQQLLAEQRQGQQLQARWNELQLELRQQALRSTINPYVQLPLDGTLKGVAEALVEASDLSSTDPELPEALAMLGALIHGQPLLVDGQLVPADEPRAVLYLEQLLANWLVRSAELISSEVLSCCASWPELRRYLLQPDLLATRNLERLRNQLNAQQRWNSWFVRPVALYESRRSLFSLQMAGIALVDLTEPRDAELKGMGWVQQLVTLSLETRDALAPQVQSLIKGLGDLFVVLLTQVVGRSIGLVGRGIREGMGRSFSRG